MATVYSYDYWKTSGAAGILTGWNYYTDEGLTNFAFQISTYKNYGIDPNVRSMFTISAGAPHPPEAGVTYYRLAPITIGAGSLTAMQVNNLVSNSITGIGTYRHAFTGGCIYDIGETGTFTPVKVGYNFAPVSLTSTQTSYIIGFVASVDSRPTKATTPAPANGATDVTLDQATLTWVDGGGADTYDVYYGTVSGSLTKISSVQAGDSLTVTGITNGSPYDYVVTRYWRIDSTNVAGTTTGDEWSFTTIDFDQIRVSYTLISEAEGGGVPGWTGYGPYDSTPGVEGIDFRYSGENNMITIRRLVAAANGKIWIEDI